MRVVSKVRGGSAPLLYCYASLCMTTAHYRRSTNFSSGPRIITDEDCGRKLCLVGLG
jgi:hypothetical protein